MDYKQPLKGCRRNIRSKIDEYKYELHLAIRDLKFGYSLPTYLVSFPRSGSNFLQNVLQKSSGFICRSIYSPNDHIKENILSLKSHALSKDYLLDEISHLYPRNLKISKIICLYRDPRDVFISFYEYAQKKLNLSISQEEFIETFDYFHVCDVDRKNNRKVCVGPLVIKDAYKKNINFWASLYSDDNTFIKIKYEELVLEPHIGFDSIFNFLNIKCSLNTKSLAELTSQYDKNRNNRGCIYTWKLNKYKYGALIEQVESNFKDEIKLLGY